MLGEIVFPEISYYNIMLIYRVSSSSSHPRDSTSNDGRTQKQRSIKPEQEYPVRVVSQGGIP